MMYQQPQMQQCYPDMQQYYMGYNPTQYGPCNPSMMSFNHGNNGMNMMQQSSMMSDNMMFGNQVMNKSMMMHNQFKSREDTKKSGSNNIGSRSKSVLGDEIDPLSLISDVERGTEKEVLENYLLVNCELVNCLRESSCVGDETDIETKHVFIGKKITNKSLRNCKIVGN